VFHELGADVVAIGCQPDGLNINDGVGATHPQALAQAVRANHADYGIALDGDADRLQMVDAQGRIFNGDELLFLMVQDRLRRSEPVGGVVGTLMTNMAVEKAWKARACPWCAPRWVTAMCWRSCSGANGFWVERDRDICWPWTSTPPVMAW
jgi:phosphoglucosamine mutase